MLTLFSSLTSNKPQTMIQVMDYLTLPALLNATEISRKYVPYLERRLCSDHVAWGAGNKELIHLAFPDA